MLLTRLPNDLMLNQWLNKKNNLSVFRFRIRGAQNVNKLAFSVFRKQYIFVKEMHKKSGNVMP